MIAFLLALNTLAIILAGCRYCVKTRREREYWAARIGGHHAS